VERGVPDRDQEYERATYSSVVPVLQFGWAQCADFGHDLRPPNLAQLIGSVVGRIGVRGVIMNPIKQCNGPQFIAQVRQRLLPPRHIGLFGPGGNVLGGGTPVDSTCRSIDLARRFDQAQQYSTPEGGAVKQKSHNEMHEDCPQP